MPIKNVYLLLGCFFSLTVLFSTSATAQVTPQLTAQPMSLEGSHNPQALPPVFLPQVMEDWTSLTDALEPRVEGHSAVIDGKIYVFGGFQTEGIVPTDQNEVYDIASNTWSTFAPLPVPNTHVGSAEADGKVWIAGGYALIGFIQTVDIVWIYDPVTNTFTDGPSLPAPRAGGVLVRLGRKLHYISGLINRNDTVGDHFVLDLDEPGGPQTWTMLAPMPDPRNHFGGIALGGKIYTIGGQFGHDLNPEDTKLLHEYDPVTDTWTRKADLPLIRSHFEPGTIAVDGKIVIVGGRTGTQNCVDTITQYDPATDTWSELFTMPDCLLAPSAKVIDDEMYVSHGGKVSVLFPTTAARKRDFARSPSTVMSFSPAVHTTTMAPGETETIEPLIWTLTDEANYTISLSGLPSWISNVSKNSGVAGAAGDEIDITINTVGLAPGVYTHTFTATASGYDNATMTVQVTVSGDGEPILAFSPAIIDLGSVPAGFTSEQTLTLTNTGTGTATFSLTGLDAGALNLAYSGAAVDVMIRPSEALLQLAPGQSTSIDLYITLLEAGAVSGSASYPYFSDGEETSVSLSFSATGAGSRIARINTGSLSAISPGVFSDWEGDQYFEAGKTFSNPDVSFVNGTLDQEPYKSERSAITNLGSFAYRIPVPSQGVYITRLHFAETFFGAPGGSIDFIGRRVFDVNIEGGLIELDDYDIAAKVGPVTAIVESFMMEVTDGVLDIEFEASVDQPKVSAIEVYKMDQVVHQPLQAGWNLAGLPVIPSSADPSNIYTDITLAETPFAYIGNSYVVPSALAMGTGFWLKLDTDDFQPHTGTLDTAIDVNLQSGWNILSGPSCSFLLEDLTGNTGILTSLSAYSYSGLTGYTLVSELQPGQGYWVQTSGAGTVSLNCAPGKTLANKATEKSHSMTGRVEDALSLTLSDARGITRTLYIKEGATEDAQFNLPPIAFRDQPDVRFSNNTSLMTSEETGIRIQAMEAPITISLAGDENPETYVLSTRNGDTWESAATLTAGNDVVLDEPALSLLLISKDIAEEAIIPDAFALQGAYPNPFQSNLTVTFDTPEDATAYVEVFDLLGKRVLQTAEASISAGARRAINIEGYSLASGAYMYRLVLKSATGTKTANGRVVLVR